MRRMTCVMIFWFFFFFKDTATTEIYTLSLHDALPISKPVSRFMLPGQLRHEPGSRWKTGDTYYVHEPVVAGKRAYVAYWDLGFAILDTRDLAHPEVISKYQ